MQVYSYMRKIYLPYYLLQNYLSTTYMKALVFHGSKDVRNDNIKDPELDKPDDIIN